MKTLILTTICSLMTSAAFAQQASPITAGNYVEKTQIGLIFVGSAEECKSDYQGDFSSGMCVVDSQNSVALSKNQQVKISIVGTNIHTCDFEGTAKADGASLIASQVVDESTGLTCQVKIDMVDANSISAKVVNHDACGQLCGANVTLDIEKATLESKR